jgi:hypothetical protein
MTVLTGSWPALAARQASVSAVPAGLQAGPDAIARLTADPHVAATGRCQRALTPRAAALPPVLTSLPMLMTPGMLTKAGPYRKRLEAPAHEIAAAGRPGTSTAEQRPEGNGQRDRVTSMPIRVDPGRSQPPGAAHRGSIPPTNRQQT